MFGSPIAVIAPVSVSVCQGRFGASVAGLPTPTVGTPTFSPGAGSYGPTTNVLITSTNSTAIYYTTDGTTPTTGSTLYSGGVSVASSLTIKALGVASGYNNSSIGSASYTINGLAATPTFSPVGGSYGPTQTVTISCSTPGSSIYYGFGGGPDTQLYTTPLTVSTTETITATGEAPAYVNSLQGSAHYTINGACATPTFSPGAGTYTGTQTVTITSTASSTIWYTTDGTTPTVGGGGTTQSIASGSTISVASSETVNAIASLTGYSNSSQGSAAYTINASGPTIAQAWNNGTSVGNFTAKWTSNTTAGNLLVVVATAYGLTASVTTPTNWTLAASQSESSGAAHVVTYIFIYVDPSGIASGTGQAFTAGTATLTWWTLEVNIASLAGTVDKTATAGATSVTAISTGTTATTTASVEIAIGIMGVAAAGIPVTLPEYNGSGISSPNSNISGAGVAMYEILSTTGTQNFSATATASSNNSGCIATIK